MKHVITKFDPVLKSSLVDSDEMEKNDEDGDHDCEEGTCKIETRADTKSHIDSSVGHNDK